MITFLIVAGFTLWIVLIITAFIGIFMLGMDGYPLGAAASAVVAVLLTAGLVTLGINSGVFEDAIPPDGCYQVTRDTDYIPVQSGKAIVPVPVEDATFIPIGCP